MMRINIFNGVLAMIACGIKKDKEQKFTRRKIFICKY